jgi:hypothetical protein
MTVIYLQPKVETPARSITSHVCPHTPVKASRTVLNPYIFKRPINLFPNASGYRLGCGDLEFYFDEVQGVHA